MATRTAIEWTEVTWNPTTGCDQISPGCDNCYALTMARRLKAMGAAKYQTDGDPATSGPGFGIATHPAALAEPYRWRTPRRVFVNSMSDLFHHAVPAAFIADVFATMAMTPQHTYQILTKRPARARTLLNDPDFQHQAWQRAAATDVNGWLGAAAHPPAAWPWPNVWIGVSVETAQQLHRIDHLRAIPTAVRFVSAEPLLGPLAGIDLTNVDWLIAGGESGPHARPLDLAWIRDLITACQTHGTAAFVKQLGTAWTGHRGKGTDPAAWPTDLQVRQWPT